MTSEDPDRPQSSVANVVYRFLGGASLGALLVFIPYSLSTIELNLLNITIALLLGILCGLLSIVLGKRFMEALIRSLEYSGFY